MKLVVAVVRPEKANDVIEALFRADVQGLTISRVQGHGGETERVETYRGTTVKVELAEKVRFEIGVSDHFVEPAVKAISAIVSEERHHHDQSASHLSTGTFWPRVLSPMVSASTESVIWLGMRL